CQMSGGKVVKIHKIDIEFPYDPYPCQMEYMTSVIESLDTCSDAALESPTGTGKTLSLLCATLAWIKDRKNRLGPSAEMAVDPTKRYIPPNYVPRIFYCSRTHSQLSQVVRELNKTKYMDVKVCTLGSRDQLCVHEQVSRERDNKTKALKCRNLVAKRSCQYYNQWNAMDTMQLDALYGEERKVLDIEDLQRVAKAHKQCPFYRSRQLRETAELTLLPYNYLIDPHLRQTHKIDLKGNIVIFDEAHNLEGVCEESVSCSISTAEVAFVIKELQSGLEALHTRNEEIRSEMDESTLALGEGMDKNKKKEKEINLTMVADILEKVFELEKNMDELWENGVETEKLEEENGENKVFAGRSMIDMLEKSGFRKENAVDYSEIMHRVASFLSDERAGEEGQVKIKDAGHKLLDFGSFLSKVFADSFEAVARRGITDKDVAGANFKVFAVKEKKKITYNYWCMTAGIAMRFLKSRGVLSMIITSGTLAPLDQFTKNLGIEFGYTLQNSHAAKSTQVSVMMVPKGRDGSMLNGSYNNRNSYSYIHGVGEGIVKTVENTPHGVLVFFSSYSIMNSCIDKWKDKGVAALSIWDRIRRRKEIVIEPKNKMELAQARFTFENAITTKGGAVFFAVCRGKVSEGIDFADTHSRAVIIVGIPYPPVNEARVRLKRNYLTECNQKDRTCMSGQQWYSMEGFRAVNQAIGRVLRHVNDFGVVVLLDSRFESAPASSFPRWVQNSFARLGNVGEMQSSLKKFFDKHGGSTGGKITPSQGAITSSIEKRSASIAIGNVKNTMEPQGIRDIANEYTAAPVIIDLEEPPKVVNVSKGFLNRVMAPSSSSIPPSPSSSTLKRALPSLAPVLDPSTVATAPSRPSPQLVKKRKIVMNSKIGEMKEKENEEEEKSSEFQNLDTKQIKEMLREANLLDAVKVAGNQFRNDKNVESLVKNLSQIFLPTHHKLFKASCVIFDASVRNAIKAHLLERGLYYT
ncbi:rtel-1, partial [Pristionchus pacificus]|uniref:Helicase ATP-binding domain-containing protein n=1 Tax=Pristionchus pacificus TaxID=54126 RepID=A0A8R1UHC1_PRIPA